MLILIQSGERPGSTDRLEGVRYPNRLSIASIPLSYSFENCPTNSRKVSYISILQIGSPAFSAGGITGLINKSKLENGNESPERKVEGNFP